MNAKYGPRGFLRTLVDPLDHVLGGGIRSGCITEIVGPAGLGKTQFCLCMCVLGCLDRLDEKGRVLYIDTEKKFSGERLCEIGKSRFPESFAETGSVDEMLRRVIVQVPSSSGNLLEILQVCKDTEIHVQHTRVLPCQRASIQFWVCVGPSRSHHRTEYCTDNNRQHSITGQGRIWQPYNTRASETPRSTGIDPEISSRIVQHTYTGDESNNNTISGWKAKACRCVGPHVGSCSQHKVGALLW